METDGNERSGGYRALDKMWQLRHQFPNDKLIVLLYDVDCNKQKQKDGNMAVYTPTKSEDRFYQKGIEHLLILPATYRTKDYSTEIKEGDIVKYVPDKQRIKNYLLSLSKDDQKKCFQNIYDILKEIAVNYS